MILRQKTLGVKWTHRHRHTLIQTELQTETPSNPDDSGRGKIDLKKLKDFRTYPIY